MKQELGPLQTKWVEALESGKYQQGKEWLRKGDDCCCLGVACCVFEIEDVKLDDGYSLYEFGEEREDACAPEELISMLKLRSKVADLFGVRFPFKESTFRDLTLANDAGATFAEIAAFIRANPHAVFTEPA